MRGKVYLRHKLGGGIGSIEGDLKWHSNSIMRVATGARTWEIPIENIAAVAFAHDLKEVVKNEKTRL